MISIKLLSCILSAAHSYNLEPELLLSIAKVESNMRETAVSPDGMDVGLMQIREKYVAETKKQLLDGCINVAVAARLLQYKRETCKHQDEHTYLVCYNRGVAGGERVKYPKKDGYYKKVMIQYRLYKGVE